MLRGALGRTTQATHNKAKAAPDVAAATGSPTNTSIQIPTAAKPSDAKR